jgi:hypothetical protein
MIEKNVINKISFGFVLPQKAQELAKKLLKPDERQYVDVFARTMIEPNASLQQAERETTGFVREFAMNGRKRLAFKLVADKLPELPEVRTRRAEFTQLKGAFEKSRKAYQAGLVLNKNPEFRPQPLEAIKTRITDLRNEFIKTQNGIAKTMINVARKGPVALLDLIPAPTAGTKVAKGIVKGKSSEKIAIDLIV